MYKEQVGLGTMFVGGRVRGGGAEVVPKFQSFYISVLLPFSQCHMDAALMMVPYMCHKESDII